MPFFKLATMIRIDSNERCFFEIVSFIYKWPNIDNKHGPSVYYAASEDVSMLFKYYESRWASVNSGFPKSVQRANCAVQIR